MYIFRYRALEQPPYLSELKALGFQRTTSMPCSRSSDACLVLVGRSLPCAPGPALPPSTASCLSGTHAVSPPGRRTSCQRFSQNVTQTEDSFLNSN